LSKIHDRKTLPTNKIPIVKGIESHLTKFGTFITWFRVSIVSFGSTETKVVQALKARACRSTPKKRKNQKSSNKSSVENMSLDLDIII
jgi:hypothetical protein